MYLNVSIYVWSCYDLSIFIYLSKYIHAIYLSQSIFYVHKSCTLYASFVHNYILSCTQTVHNILYCAYIVHEYRAQFMPNSVRRSLEGVILRFFFENRYAQFFVCSTFFYTISTFCAHIVNIIRNWARAKELCA